MNGKLKMCGVALLLALSAGSLGAESGVALAVNQGGGWLHKTVMFILPMTTKPQYAAWVETADGAYVETLVVTGSAANGKWKGNPKGGRPDALPVWSHAVAGKSVDATTSATVDADSGIAASAGGLVSGDAYVVRFEINHSFDYNDAWTKKAKAGDPGYSGVNGQPSLVYEGRFTAGKAGTVALVPVGHGAVDGKDGTVVRDLSGMTTALDIVQSVSVSIKGE